MLTTYVYGGHSWQRDKLKEQLLKDSLMKSVKKKWIQLDQNKYSEDVFFMKVQTSKPQQETFHERYSNCHTTKIQTLRMDEGQNSKQKIRQIRRVSDVWLTVRRNSVWIRKTNQMSLFVFFISLLIVAQHVSGNHVPIIRS